MNIDKIVIKNKQLDEKNNDLKEKTKKYTAVKRNCSKNILLKKSFKN